MSIPTGGTNPVTTYTATATWESNISLIGDSENLTGVNSDSETDTLNRAAMSNANRTQFLYNEATRAAVSINNSLINTKLILDTFVTGKRIDHDIVVTWIKNESITDGPIELKGLSGSGSVTIDLGGYTATPSGTFSSLRSAFDIQNCTIPIKIMNGTIDDTTPDKLAYHLYVKGCSNLVDLEDLTTVFKNGGAFSSNHYEIISSPNVEINGGDLSYGINGINCTRNSKVLSISQTTTQNASGYGLVAELGGIIAKSGGQPTGTTGNENTSTGGQIN